MKSDQGAVWMIPRGRTKFETAPYSSSVGPLLQMKRLTKCSCKISSGQSVRVLPVGLRPTLFSKLTKSELSAVLSAASHRRFLEYSVIVQEGDPAERFFLLTSGHGRQFVLTRDGRKIVLASLPAGKIFGGNAILSTPTTYFASTEVLSYSCALMWDRKAIRRLSAQIPQLLDNALSIAVHEYIAPLLHGKISLASESAQSRIADLLVSLASEVGKKVSEGVEISVSNEDLAAGASVTPFTVSRSISRWQREGILEKKRRKVILRKPELLNAESLDSRL
jgi:CRP-like cAMP-binding protein